MPEGGMFRRLADGLSRTRESLFGNLAALVGVKGIVDDELLLVLEEGLLAADVGPTTTDKLVAMMRETAKGKRFESKREFEAVIKKQIAALLEEAREKNTNERRVAPAMRPMVIMVVGVNGAGKTTTIGKLAHDYQSQGKSVMIAAADTYRAAALQQLEAWAERAGVAMVHQAPGADPASVAFDTVSSALARKTDVVLIDTAGRLHTKVNLMEELRKIHRVVGKQVVGAPHEVLLVVDAGTGQNGLQQVRQFGEAAGVTGIVLTKLDGTAKGGVVLAMCGEMKIPVKYIGVGERLEDLQPFDAEVFVEALFDSSEKVTPVRVSE